MSNQFSQSTSARPVALTLFVIAVGLFVFSAISFIVGGSPLSGWSGLIAGVVLAVVGVVLLRQKIV